MIISCHLGSKLSFLDGIINNLVSVTDPTAFGFVDLVWVKVFVSVRHRCLYYITDC